MAKVTYSSLQLKPREDVKEIEINNKKIEVKQYLSANDKNSILESTIQKADEDSTILNTFALEIYFNMFVIFKYTNITFTQNQKEDLLKLYDAFESSGAMNKILSAIPYEEYDDLRANLEDMVKEYNNYRNSAKAIVEQFKMFAPQQAVNIQEQLKDFDVEKLSNVLSLAQKTGLNNSGQK